MTSPQPREEARTPHGWTDHRPGRGRGRRHPMRKASVIGAIPGIGVGRRTRRCSAGKGSCRLRRSAWWSRAGVLLRDGRPPRASGRRPRPDVSGRRESSEGGASPSGGGSCPRLQAPVARWWLAHDRAARLGSLQAGRLRRLDGEQSRLALGSRERALIIGLVLRPPSGGTDDARFSAKVSTLRPSHSRRGGAIACRPLSAASQTRWAGACAVVRPSPD